jgi:hypothetical protein
MNQLHSLFNFTENPKDMRLGLPKINQIARKINWTKNPDKILSKEALKIFPNMNNTFKPVNEINE